MLIYIQHHKIEFCCVKQPSNGTRDAYYAIHHMQGFMWGQQRHILPSHVHKWGQYLETSSDGDLKLEFYHIQQKLAPIIYKDVYKSDGIFGGGNPDRREVEDCLEIQGDDRPLNTLGGLRPFPVRLHRCFCLLSTLLVNLYDELVA
jgi:hypothetical protein